MTGNATAQDDVPRSAPEHCPGTRSEQAGRASSCAGCPNQTACAEAPKGPDPDISSIAANLAGVHQRILVLSGKGGVGKSTVASQLALMLASDPNRSIGLLDVDICGPSQPRMMGVDGESLHGSRHGLTPVYAGPNGNIAVASVGFLLDEEAVIWRGPKKTGMLKTFLRDVDWSDLDFLIVDAPPGTSDEHLALASYIKPVTGAILVTGPQELAWQDVRKEADFCRKVGIPIMGIVENMATFRCAHCCKESSIFPSRAGKIQEWASKQGIPFASIPLDPRVARSLDSGEPFVIEHHDSDVALAYLRICNEMLLPGQT